MADSLDLGTAGIRVFAGELYHHDYLWFSSFEIAKTTRTAPIVHNYALSYAISGYNHGQYRGSLPSYDVDLAAMSVYTTPARPGESHHVHWTRLTQNAIDTRTMRTEGPRGFNSPALGWRVVLDPCWEVESAELGFRFYAFVRGDYSLPSVIRLGKKGCPVRIRWNSISAKRATRVAAAVQPSHAINPLDVQGRIISYQPISIPPHLIFRTAEIADDWVLFEGSNCIHVPRRFTPAGPVTIGQGGAMRPPRPRRRRAT